MLMFAVFAISLGFMVALPVWKTELQREKEEELIFRGKQYAEAVRIYVQKNPGRFPESFKDLLDKKCIRRLYKDPLGPGGEWNVILATGAAASSGTSARSTSRSSGGSAARTPAGAGPGGGAGAGARGAVSEVMVAPERALPAIKNPRILGVVSSSTDKSVKIYNDQDSHDKWLFFFGQDPKKPPKIVPYGEDR